MTTRKSMAAANWKMFKTVAETAAYLEELRPLVAGVAGVEVVVAPPFTLIPAAAAAAQGTSVIVAGQNLFWETQGAFTGEISAAMLRDAGAWAVIIGHSERRTKFGETDQNVNRKLQAALAEGLLPIVCIGETLAEREAGATFEVLDRQLQAGLAGLTATQAGGLVIAYEPVWAIGTGRNATPEQAQEAHAHIRGAVGRLFGRESGAAVPDPLRRQRQAGQHRPDRRSGRRGRGADRRGEPRCQGVCHDGGALPGGAGIIGVCPWAAGPRGSTGERDAVLSTSSLLSTSSSACCCCWSSCCSRGGAATSRLPSAGRAARPRSVPGAAPRC